jgi:hypothetical protein
MIIRYPRGEQRAASSEQPAFNALTEEKPAHTADSVPGIRWVRPGDVLAGRDCGGTDGPGCEHQTTLSGRQEPYLAAEQRAEPGVCGMAGQL